MIAIIINADVNRLHSYFDKAPSFSHQSKQCIIIEFRNIWSTCPLNSRVLYPTYTFQVATIIIGATGFVPKCVINNLKMFGFNERAKNAHLQITN